MKVLKGLIVAMGALSGLFIAYYWFEIRLPGDKAYGEATTLCASVVIGANLTWDLLDAAHFMKLDDLRADRSQPPGDGTYLMLTSGGPSAQYGCELEYRAGKITQANAVELPGWR
jgi:hypothetical protein